MYCYAVQQRHFLPTHQLLNIDKNDHFCFHRGQANNVFSIDVGDLLLLFLYLEVMSMLNHYLGSGNLPVRYPLYIGIIALARYLVLEIDKINAVTMFALSGSILLISFAILILRYGHVRFPYTDCPSQSDN